MCRFISWHGVCRGKDLCGCDLLLCVGLFHDMVCAEGRICVAVTCCVWIYFMTQCGQGQGSVWMY